MKIYLVRHGETDYNKESKLQGWTDIPLNEAGIELAKKTSEGLKDIEFDAVFSSPLIRAYTTAEIILRKRPLKIEKDDRLKEIHFGPHEGDLFSEVKGNANHPIHNFFCNPGLYSPTDGSESIDDVKKRAANFLKEKIIPLEGKFSNILIVGHGCLNLSILNPILGVSNDDFWKYRLKNCSVSIISLENGKLNVLEKGKVFY